jgi:type II restriction enzyme
MRYDEVVSLICSPSNDERLDFTARANRLKVAADALTVEEVLEHLDYAGVIPESFGQDSSEEMLYTKYCNALLARALRELGLKARTDAADVSANGDDYSIVGNAKAFRLSRPPKHQKDFAVEALNKRRKGANFACLVCPLYQYPDKGSQIYELAAKCNVTLLSYSHLAFMIKRGPQPRPSLRDIWKEIIDRGSIKRKLQLRKVGSPEGYWRRVKGNTDPGTYWRALDMAMLAWAGANEAQWEEARRAASARLRLWAEEQIQFYEREKARVEKLPNATVVKELVVEIDEKVQAIRETVSI